MQGSITASLKRCHKVKERKLILMRYNVIAIEREYASGGREIGEKLAERLGIPCHGHDILEKAARKTGLSLGELSNLEESMTGSLLYNFSMLADITAGRSVESTKAQKLALVESDIIQNLSLSPCVIIGRGAAGLLKDRESALKVFIHADYETRIERAVDIYQNDFMQAEKVLHQQDKRRANYFKAATGVEWKDTDIYHLFLNSGKLGVDLAVDILHASIK